MKKLKLNKQTVSILGTIEQKNIAGGGETGSSPCVNWTSYKATVCYDAYRRSDTGVCTAH